MAVRSTSRCDGTALNMEMSLRLCDKTTLHLSHCLSHHLKSVMFVGMNHLENPFCYTSDMKKLSARVIDDII